MEPRNGTLPPYARQSLEEELRMLRTELEGEYRRGRGQGMQALTEEVLTWAPGEFHLARDLDSVRVHEDELEKRLRIIASAQEIPIIRIKRSRGIPMLFGKAPDRYRLDMPTEAPDMALTYRDMRIRVVESMKRGTLPPTWTTMEDTLRESPHELYRRLQPYAQEIWSLLRGILIALPDKPHIEIPGVIIGKYAHVDITPHGLAVNNGAHAIGDWQGGRYADQRPKYKHSIRVAFNDQILRDAIIEELPIPYIVTRTSLLCYNPERCKL